MADCGLRWRFGREQATAEKTTNRSTRAGRPPELDGREGRKAVAIVEACYRSARTGRAARVAAG
jgi:predicted dehydrogenase